MPGRSHEHESTPEGDEPAHHHAPGPAHFESVRQTENTVRAALQAGRVSSIRGSGHSGETPPTSTDMLTRASGTANGAPEGHPTAIGADEDASTTRSLEMENSGAATFAAAGYRIKQNPTPAEVAHARQQSGDTGDPDKRPDYLIEGRVFDAYSPTSPAKAVRGIWSEARQKVAEDRQTQRVAINLEDWRGDMDALGRQFTEWPIPGLKEVKAITPDGDIVQIDLPPST